MAYSYNRLSLLSSNARIQVPWVKVTLKSDTNEFTFGVFTRTAKNLNSGDTEKLKATYNVQYPNYVQSLQVTKVNGQFNQYKLDIKYPITANDDPNFFEKIFSSVSKTRKMILTYGDAAMPTYVYQDETATITTVTQSFDLEGSAIAYTINAVSNSLMTTEGCLNFPRYSCAKPSSIILQLFQNYQSLRGTFSGMNMKNWYNLVASDDKAVEIQAKTNISLIDYIRYLASCMYTAGTDTSNPTSIYIMTIYDCTTYDTLYDKSGAWYSRDADMAGPYFKISKVTYNNVGDRSDAYELDVGVNTSTIVTGFSLENSENYALYYDYQQKLNKYDYVKQLNNKGQWEDVYAPTMISRNEQHRARAEDKTWWTKITQYPVNATVTVQGLLRPAKLLTYIRLNVIFPGGHKHISSGLYIITKQVDTISDQGYRSQISMTKVGGALTDKEDNSSLLNSGISRNYDE